MSNYYILDDAHKPVAVDLMTWARAFEHREKRHVAQDFVGDVHVSTVFLGLDHRFTPQGPPILFETMIFGGEHDQYQDRCSTWTEAKAMHAKALSMVKAGSK